MLYAAILHSGMQVGIVVFQQCHEQGVVEGLIICFLEVVLLGPAHTLGWLTLLWSGWWSWQRRYYLLLE
jgi:hypothetical protein